MFTMAIQSRYILRLLIFCICLLRQTFGFSLLGPFAPWMTPEVGFIQDEAYDVGGPRNLGDEFRWNVPVLTYGFDDNFKDFFGQPGIDAVEKAVAILNALPPASQTDLLPLPSDTTRQNPTAQEQGLFDLKSFALAFLVEQIGLANPVRFTWIVTTTNAPIFATEDSGPNDFMYQRNFDPLNLSPTSVVNTIRYSYRIEQFLFPWLPEVNRLASLFAITPDSPYQRGVAAVLPNPIGTHLIQGEYFTALTRDDRGGLKFLLHTNNVNVEPVLLSVHAFGGGLDFVNVAARPGIDKITFQRFDPGLPSITNFFLDSYFLDGSIKTQFLQRVIQAPDILFTAANHPRVFDAPAFVRRTRPNFSHQNETGPGILQPEIVISFQKLGDINREPLWTSGDEVIDYRWSSYDVRTVIPPIFPVGPAYQGGRTLSVRKLDLTNGRAIEWKLRLIAGVQYSIESSSDLINWTALTNITAAPIHTLTNSAPSDQSTTFWRARRIVGQ
jgi:hypothetical protein